MRLEWSGSCGSAVAEDADVAAVGDELGARAVRTEVHARAVGCVFVVNLRMRIPRTLLWSHCVSLHPESP